jgi:hypothetical protein
MTPSLPDLLAGQAAALAAPQPPEAGGDYLAGRVGMIVMLAALMAQEAEHGTAARVWENAAIRTLFADIDEIYDRSCGGALSAASVGFDRDLTWSALDHANARLRRLLIRLHEMAEARGDAALDAVILALYRDMAHHRRLEFPNGQAV